MKKAKIFCVCGTGLGTSLMAKMATDKLLKEISFDAKVEVIDAGSIKGEKGDLIITTTTMAKALKVNNIKVVAIKNFANKADLRENVLPELEKLKAEYS